MLFYIFGWLSAMNEDSQWLADRQYYVYFYFYYILNIKRLRNRYAEAYILFSGSVAYHIKIKIFGSLFHFPQSCRYFKRNVYKIEKMEQMPTLAKSTGIGFLHLIFFIILILLSRTLCEKFVSRSTLLMTYGLWFDFW